jgi:hypothetical protein
LQRGQIAPDFLKYFNHQVAVLPGNAGKRFSVRHVHQPPDLIDERFAADLQIDTVRAAIRRISTSLQASKGFQTVTSTLHRERRNVGRAPTTDTFRGDGLTITSERMRMRVSPKDCITRDVVTATLSATDSRRLPH